MTEPSADHEPMCVRTRTTGGVRVVSVTGEIDLATAPAVGAALAERASGESALVLDLRETAFLDSSGIRVLVEAHRASQRDGIPFTVVPGDAAIRDLLETTGVAAHLDLADTAPE
jgi:anti-sigma B factor antagonist